MPIKLPKWFPFLTIADVGGIALAAILVAAALGFLVFAEPLKIRQNFGFSADWDCQSVRGADLNCIKR